MAVDLPAGRALRRCRSWLDRAGTACASRSDRRATRPTSWRAHRAPRAGGGKFENLNEVVDRGEADWTLVVDDDVVLPERFLDRFVGAGERLDLALAQPAQTHASHAAWRSPAAARALLVRETRFVEIGPVTAFRRRRAAGAAAVPAAALRLGARPPLGGVAEERGWRLGIVDALPVRHDEGAVARLPTRRRGDRGGAGASSPTGRTCRARGCRRRSRCTRA